MNSGSSTYTKRASICFKSSIIGLRINWIPNTATALLKNCGSDFKAFAPLTQQYLSIESPGIPYKNCLMEVTIFWNGCLPRVLCYSDSALACCRYCCAWPPHKRMEKSLWNSKPSFDRLRTVYLAVSSRSVALYSAFMSNVVVYNAKIAN